MLPGFAEAAAVNGDNAPPMQSIVDYTHNGPRFQQVLYHRIIGLDVGYTLVGATRITLGWTLGRRLGLVGAGIGVVVQGCALALLDLVLAAQISR